MKLKTKIKRKIKKTLNKIFTEKRKDILVLSLFAIAIALIGYLGQIPVYASQNATVTATARKNTLPTATTTPQKEPTVKEYVKAEIEKAGLRFSDVDCLVSHESGWNEYSIGDNANGAGVDRGLYQFSSIWHKEISNKDAFDYKKATKEFIKIVKQDKNYHQWHGFNNNCQ